MNITKQEYMASANVQRFWHQLTKRVTYAKFELNKEEHSIWLETWNAAAGGASGPLHILPIAYLRLPATAGFSPPAGVIINVLIKVVVALKKSPKEHFSAINVLEAVFDTINLRAISLVKENSVSNGQVILKSIEELDNVLLTSITISISQYPENSDRFARLILRRNELNELKKAVTEYSKNQHLATEVINFNKYPWLGWQQSPKLDWLMASSWHNVEGLKAMYESSEEYTESLLKLWTLLTFYWGSGAVWPKCTFKQGGGGGDPNSALNNACGEPLLTMASSGTCRRCGGIAVCRCFRRNHDHICKNCLMRQQDAMVGSPGHTASTDIYDGLVEREVVRREETVYLLKNLESRKPPKIAPNWKTSRKLNFKGF